MKQIRRSQIKNAPYNPRKIKPGNRARLKNSLDEFGLVEPLVWNETTGNLVGGHRRLEHIDAVENGGEFSLTVSAIRIPLAREKALNVMLNNASAQGEFDDQLLANLLRDLASQAGHLELSGFSQDDLARLTAENVVPDAQFPITAKLNERYDFVLIFCDNETDFAHLQSMCGVKTERSYKKTGVGLGRAVPFARFKQMIDGRSMATRRQI